MKVGSLNFLCILFVLLGCAESKKNEVPKARKVDAAYTLRTPKSEEKQRLSDYAFFKGRLADLTPTANVYPYAINAPLFSNYAEKARFIYLPEQVAMNFVPEGVFDFDEGAILIKNFFYSNKRSNGENERKIIETRLLIKEKELWKPLNYLWNENQTEAYLDYVGKTIPVAWQDPQGKERKVNYVVPNNNQCKNCHNADNKITPIGITAAQLNQRYFASNDSINQLEFFKSKTLLKHFTKASDYLPMPSWNDVLTATLDQRARAYLDANCAHCHSAVGSAKNSGLYLNYHQNDSRKRGVLKPPIAAGKGSGDFQYDIVPGKPEESIFIYRMKSNDPAIRMPEIGRSVVHEEGVALLTAYIESLASQ